MKWQIFNAQVGGKQTVKQAVLGAALLWLQTRVCLVIQVYGSAVAFRKDWDMRHGQSRSLCRMLAAPER